MVILRSSRQISLANIVPQWTWGGMSFTSIANDIHLRKAVTQNSLKEFGFSKFVAENFAGLEHGQHSKKPLKRALLRHQQDFDNIAARVIWLTGLRLMGDLPEPSYKSSRQSSCSVMEELRVTFEQCGITSKAVSFSSQLSETFSKSSKRSNINKIPRDLLHETSDIEYYQQILTTHSNHLTKLHFILGHGLLRPDLRDEIYVQVCKQLTNNPSSSSFAKGWLLLTLCIGCFAPSPRFESYLRCFVQNGPAEYAANCLQLLERTLKNGSRKQPASLPEVEAACTRQSIEVSIHLMNDSVTNLKVDPATTASEIISEICRTIDLHDCFGFSLVISCNGSSISLGCGRQHLFDAVFCVEEFEAGEGQSWRLSMRRELFAPRYDPQLDRLASELTYKQIVAGLKLGDYACESNDEFASLCALIYFAEHGEVFDEEHFRELVTKFNPSHSTQNRAQLDELQQKTSERFLHILRKYTSKQQAVEDICLFAKENWAEFFQRSFEVKQLDTREKLMMYISANGLWLRDRHGSVVNKLAYENLGDLHFKPTKNDFILSTKAGLELCFQSPDNAEIVAILKVMLGNESAAAVSASALVDLEVESIPKTTPCKLLKVSWGSLESLSSMQTIPCQVKGPADHKPDSLKIFAETHFREKISSEAELWRHSSEPLRQPLLKQTARDVECFQNSLVIHHHMLKYMGDLKIDQPKAGANTELIFRPAINYVPLRDELYCQLMKQLTENPNESSVERGWELMTLATGSIMPTSLIAKQLEKFLSQQACNRARFCEQRLKAISAHGTRKRPPCVQEVEAVQKQLPGIKQKVFFPNGMMEEFDIQSYTRCSQLAESIRQRFNLQTTRGYSFSIMIDNKSHFLATEEYIFDALSQALHNANTQHSLRRPIYHQSTDQLFFKNKLCLRPLALDEPNAVDLFLYPQAVQSYLNGYFNIKSLATTQRLAGLIYIAEYGSSLSDFLKVHNILQQLLPVSMLPQRQFEDWKALLKTEIQQLQMSGFDQQQAKSQFLQILAGESIFGATFFTVKQTEESNWPKQMLLAVNEIGLHLMEVEAMSVIQTFGYANIRSLASLGSDKIDLQFSSQTGYQKLLLHSAQAADVIDLFNDYLSYVTHSLNEIKQERVN